MVSTLASSSRTVRAVAVCCLAANGVVAIAQRQWSLLRTTGPTPLCCFRAVYNACDDLVLDGMDAVERALLESAAAASKPTQPRARAAGKASVLDSAIVAEIKQVRCDNNCSSAGRRRNSLLMAPPEKVLVGAHLKRDPCLMKRQNLLLLTTERWGAISTSASTPLVPSEETGRQFSPRT